MTREALLAFMRSERYAGQASVSTGHSPQAAVAGIAVSDTVEVVFDTSRSRPSGLRSSDSDRSGDR
jgi:hypothetical protein